MAEPLFLFDLDGTLVDTAPDFLQLCNEMRAALQLQPLQIEQLRPLVNAGARAMVALALNVAAQAPECELATQDFLARYEKRAGQFALVYPGLSALVQQLRQSGCRWGVVTNKHRRFALPLLARLGLQPDVLVCGDDVSHAKPHPESLLLACQSTGCLPAHTCYAGDHERDMGAAKSAGAVAVAACYGYIGADQNPRDWQADYWVQSSQQLSELFWRLATQEWKRP